MIQARIQFNLANARQYFREHLSVGDYYSQDEKISGEWLGRGAEKLGLTGKVGEDAFLALCEGKHPQTGEQLGQRLNTVRLSPRNQMKANRRIFYDFAIAPPKSVSVVALYQDDRIVELHRQAVKTAMSALENYAEARVRKRGQHSERRTENFVAATFRHDTSRELDPHLHTHCVVFNATYDATESRWKALEVQAMYRAQLFATNLYRHELAKGLRAFGYEIENSPRSFEIKGVPQSVIARFSKRHNQIDAEANKQLEIGSPAANVGELRKRIAQGNRRRKLKDSTADRLRPTWENQLSKDEAKALAGLGASAPEPHGPADVRALVAWADEHLFERRSVVREADLMAAALDRGRGEDFDLTALAATFDERRYVREVGSDRLTSREVLGRELDIVVAAHDGRGRHAAFNSAHECSANLSPEQRSAVDRILKSRDFITLFRGGAGTGKSFALKAVESGLVAAAYPVVVLAPQRQQVQDLQADRLPAETISRFLAAKQLARGAVVIVDEAGQVGGKQLHDLIGVVRASGGRLILSGDTRQHGAVPASDALRAIEKHAGLKPAEISRIRRQDPALGGTVQERSFIRHYRTAVKAAAKGDVAGSFERLDRLGCIRECGGEDRPSLLVSEYLAASARKEKTLVVGQTRDEVRAINETIRERLRASGKLGRDKTVTAYEPVDLGAAQKRDPRFYQAGQHAFFVQRYGRYAKGDLCEIAESTERGLVVVKGGRRSLLSYRYADRISVVAAQETALAPGDRLQLKLNGKSAEGVKFNNGELVTVKTLRRDGGMVVEGADGQRKTLAPSQRVFTRGYAVTSYGSQGKTVDTVIFSDAASAAATNANQWYVSISRGRKRVVVFTPDKEALRANILQSGERELALDLKTATPVLPPEWTIRARAVVARQRHHQAVMAHVQKPTPARRIAI